MAYYTDKKKARLRAITRRFLQGVDYAMLSGDFPDYKSLCQKIDVQPTRLSQLRDGKGVVTLYQVANLCKVAGLSADFILSGRGEAVSKEGQ